MALVFSLPVFYQRSPWPSSESGIEAAAQHGFQSARDRGFAQKFTTAILWRFGFARCRAPLSHGIKVKPIWTPSFPHAL